jgi:hypothetical protein
MHRKHSFPLIALVAALTLLPPAAGAQVVQVDQPTTQPDSALGALASVGCGFFVRASIVTAGTQVGTIVGAVACCGYMLFDALVVEHH